MPMTRFVSQTRGAVKQKSPETAQVHFVKGSQNIGLTLWALFREYGICEAFADA